MVHGETLYSNICFYILIMYEKVLVLCEKWFSKFSSNLLRFETHTQRKDQ